jgi:hypothetical protein
MHAARSVILNLQCKARIVSIKQSDDNLLIAGENDVMTVELFTHDTTHPTGSQGPEGQTDLSGMSRVCSRQTV